MPKKNKGNNKNSKRPLENITFEDGHRYNQMGTVNENDPEIKVKCVLYNSGRCRAIGIYNKENKTIVLKDKHIHGPNEAVVKKKQMLKNLKNHCSNVKNSLKQSKAIYDNVIDEELPSEQSVHQPYTRFKRQINYYKKQSIPLIPKDLEDFGKKMTENDWLQSLTEGEEILEAETIKSRDGSTSVVFFDRKIIEKTSSTDFVHIDGTFDSKPNIPGVMQLLVMIAVIMNTAIPFCWILMERQTTEAYTSVFNFIFNVIATKMRPRNFMADFEAAFRTSIYGIFGDTDINFYGCFFHFAQALLKQAKRKGLLKKEEDDDFLFLSRLTCLALLPASVIFDTYTKLKNNLNMDQRERYSAYLQYFERYWLQQVGPEGFSVFKLRHRTNNIQETNNKQILTLTGRKPSPYFFAAKICQIVLTLRRNINCLEKGIKITPPMSESQFIKEKQLLDKWNKLTEGADPYQFILDVARDKNVVAEIMRANNDYTNAESQILEADDLDDQEQSFNDVINQIHKEYHFANGQIQIDDPNDQERSFNEEFNQLQNHFYFANGQV